jgi:hypothetical protein
VRITRLVGRPGGTSMRVIVALGSNDSCGVMDTRAMPTPTLEIVAHILPTGALDRVGRQPHSHRNFTAPPVPFH